MSALFLENHFRRTKSPAALDFNPNKRLTDSYGITLAARASPLIIPALLFRCNLQTPTSRLRWLFARPLLPADYLGNPFKISIHVSMYAAGGLTVSGILELIYTGPDRVYGIKFARGR